MYSSVKPTGGGFWIVPLNRRQRRQQQEPQPLIDGIGQGAVDECRCFFEIRQERSRYTEAKFDIAHNVDVPEDYMVNVT